MYQRFTILLVFLVATTCFAASDSPLIRELKTAEALLEQAEKQTKERQQRDKIKNAKKELEYLRKRIEKGSVTDVILPILSFQKRLRTHPDQEKLKATQVQISKILSTQNAFRSVRRKEYGLQIMELLAPEGRFSLYFPDDVQESDAFTFSVHLQPFGLTDEDKAENERVLSGYQIQFASRGLKITTTLQQVTIGSAPSSTEVTMKTMEDYLAAKFELSFPKAHAKSENGSESLPPIKHELEADMNPPRDPVIDVDIPQLLFQLPRLNQAGRYLEIRGPFDGIAENTSLSINKNGTYIVAESLRKIVALNPRITGFQQLSLVEGQKRVRCRYRNLDLRSWASAETLASGAHAIFTIQLDAAANVKTPLVIAVENRTPEIISLENGSFQYITVNPTMLNEAGSLTLSRTLTGMHPAPFRIDARLDTTHLFATCSPPID